MQSHNANCRNICEKRSSEASVPRYGGYLDQREVKCNKRLEGVYYANKLRLVGSIGTLDRKQLQALVAYKPYGCKAYWVLMKHHSERKL